MRTRSNSSSARFRASTSLDASCRRIASVIWRPTVYTGSSASIGSWKIIDAVPPRNADSALPDKPSTSTPATLMRPSMVARRSSCNRKIERSVTLLPEPDSPKIPSTSPRASVRSTPSTARTTLAPPRNVTPRFSIRRISSVAVVMPAAPVPCIRTRDQPYGRRFHDPGRSSSTSARWLGKSPLHSHTAYEIGSPVGDRSGWADHP